MFSDEYDVVGVQPVPFLRMAYPMTVDSAFVISLIDSASTKPNSSINAFSF